MLSGAEGRRFFDARAFSSESVLFFSAFCGGYFFPQSSCFPPLFPRASFLYGVKEEIGKRR